MSKTRPAQHCAKCKRSRERLKVLEKRIQNQMATISQQYAELRGYRLNLVQYEAAVKANAEAELRAKSGHKGKDASAEAGNDPVPADVAVDASGGHSDSDSEHSRGEDG